MAAAAPKPEDRLAFADELAQVRAKDVDGEYKKELDELEVEYQFILLRSLVLFHKEMRSGSLPERLHEIKENLTGYSGDVYISNQPSYHQLELEQHHMQTVPQDELEAYAGLQMSFAAKYAESWKHWMGPTLMMKNSISAAMISRSLNNVAPGGNTASCVTWKIKEKSSQQTDIHCPLKQLIKPMRSSRELKNICQSESRRRLWLTRS